MIVYRFEVQFVGGKGVLAGLWLGTPDMEDFRTYGLRVPIRSVRKTLPDRVWDFCGMGRLPTGRLLMFEGLKPRTIMGQLSRKNFGDLRAINARSSEYGHIAFTILYSEPGQRVTLPCMERINDGAHRGPSDWYPALEDGLRKALEGEGGWTTGWYGSKHEVASACISSYDERFFLKTADGKRKGRMFQHRVRYYGVEVEVTVSNDFDDEGRAVRRTPANVRYGVEDLRGLVDQVYDLAVDDQKEGSTVDLYAVGRRSGKKARGNRLTNWIETFLYDLSGELMRETPPGGHYEKWGWQGETGVIPAPNLARLEDGIRRRRPRVVSGPWIAERVE